MKADSGKSIPLVPGTNTPHKCPEKEVVHDFDKTKEAPREQEQENAENVPEQEQLKEEAPPHREFDEEKIKAEVKRISVWVKFCASLDFYLARRSIDDHFWIWIYRVGHWQF